MAYLDDNIKKNKIGPGSSLFEEIQRNNNNSKFPTWQ